MRPARRVLKSGVLRPLICWLAATYIRLIYYTGRWRYIGIETVRSMGAAREAFIICCWHGRILLMPYSWEGRTNVHVLISDHMDGQLIAQTVRHFGISAIAGSSSKGGSEGLRAMLKTLKDRQWVGITPDGPRGPRMRAASGVVTLARLAGVPIIPGTFGVSRRKLLRSWDRLCVPLPFCRGVFIWGEPIRVPRDADEAALERARRKVEEELNQITWEADRLCGHGRVEPAAVPEDSRAPAPAGDLRATG